MKRTTVLIALFSLIFAAAAFAGERHAKCTDDPQTCLNRLSEKIASKGWLGVSLEKHEKLGYTVTAITADSPAEAAGLKAGDVLVALNGISFAAENKDALKKIKKGFAPGTTATYTVKRQGAKQQVAVALGHVPATVMAEWIGQHMIENHVQVAAK